MTPTCLTCGRPVEEGRTCCHTCLAKLCSDSICLDADAAIKAFDSAMPKPEPTHHCPDCGDPIQPGQTLCDFCTYKHLHSQSYPPSIVRAATDAMKAAMIDSILLSVDNMTQQLGMMRNLLVAMKEVDQ